MQNIVAKGKTVGVGKMVAAGFKCIVHVSTLLDALWPIELDTPEYHGYPCIKDPIDILRFIKAVCTCLITSCNIRQCSSDKIINAGSLAMYYAWLSGYIMSQWIVKLVPHNIMHSELSHTFVLACRGCAVSADEQNPLLRANSWSEWLFTTTIATHTNSSACI